MNLGKCWIYKQHRPSEFCISSFTSSINKKEEEISEKIEHHKNIDFKYFETNVQGNELSFQYTLKEGVSQDRIGYLILEREGVVNLLQSN